MRGQVPAGVGKHARHGDTVRSGSLNAEGGLVVRATHRREPDYGRLISAIRVTH